MLSPSTSFCVGLGLVISCFLELILLPHPTLAQVINNTATNSSRFNTTLPRLNVDFTSTQTGQLSGLTQLETPHNQFINNPSFLFQFNPTLNLIQENHLATDSLYLPVGVPSRIFPGLTGLQKVRNSTNFSFSEFKKFSE